MGFCDLLQRQHAPNPWSEVAALQGLEHFLRRRLERAAGEGIAEAYPRELQAAAVAQKVHRDRRHHPGRIAEAPHAPARREAGDRALPGRLPNEIVTAATPPPASSRTRSGQ